MTAPACGEVVSGEVSEYDASRAAYTATRRTDPRIAAAVERALGDLRAAAAGRANLMALLIEAARAHATEGEIVHALQDVWGAFTETPVF